MCSNTPVSLRVDQTEFGVVRSVEPTLVSVTNFIITVALGSEHTNGPFRAAILAHGDVAWSPDTLLTPCDCSWKIVSDFCHNRTT